MNNVLGRVKLQNERLNKDLQKRAEQRKIEKIEKAAAKERKKREKEKKKNKEEGKLTSTQSAKKYVTDKANKAYYGNFQEKYISIYGEGKSDKDAKYGTVWQQIYSVRKDYLDNDNNNTEQDEIDKILEQAGVTEKEKVEIDEKYADYIKDGKIRQKNITGKDYIIIPYENSESIYDLLIKGELDETTEPDEYNIREFKKGQYTRITQTKNDSEYYYYYIPVVIKEHVKFAKIMEYYQDKKNSNEKKREKEEKAAEINENNKERYNIKNKFDETMKSINSVNDILHDNELLSFLPCKKISKAYCYIHPINVILYDKTIEYGLIWRKNNNVIDNDDYVDIDYFFSLKKDTKAFDIFKKIFDNEYSEDKYLIDLSEYKDIVEITKKYDFSQGNLYYKREETSTYYVCEPTKFDYKYKQGSFDNEEYFKTHQISDNLKKDKENITALQEKINDNIHELIEKAGENIKFNKEKTSYRQIESDAKIEENKNKFFYYIFYVILSYLKYVQDTFFAGIKTLFSSKWNNVMTGFLILIFIIVLIFVGISAGEEEKNEGPNKKPKEENKDFFAVIKSIPADMNNVYNSAIKLSSDVTNMISNSRRTVNDIADAITGDDNSDDIDRHSLDDGRGGDNFIHFDNGGIVDSKYSMKGTQIDQKINNINYDGSPSQLTAINSTITLGTKDVSVNAGDARMFVPDCASNGNNYFDDKCKLIEHDPDSKVAIVKDSDYEQIKIND